jgi:hypothetical protein
LDSGESTGIVDPTSPVSGGIARDGAVPYGSGFAGEVGSGEDPPPLAAEESLALTVERFNVNVLLKL